MRGRCESSLLCTHRASFSVFRARVYLSLSCQPLGHHRTLPIGLPTSFLTLSVSSQQLYPSSSFWLALPSPPPLGLFTVFLSVFSGPKLGPPVCQASTLPLNAVLSLFSQLLSRLALNSSHSVAQADLELQHPLPSACQVPESGSMAPGPALRLFSV